MAELKNNTTNTTGLRFDLRSPDFLEAVKSEVNDIVVEGDFERAYKLAKNLSTLIQEDKNLQQDMPELLGQYQQAVNLAKWVSLHLYSENQIISMLEEDAATAIKDPDIILWDSLKTFLLSSVLIEDRDNVKRRFREALLRNNQVLTSTSISNNQGELDGTVGNWLDEYNSKLGAAPLQQRSLEIYKYLSQDKNIQKVSTEDKKSLIRLFDTYERLKRSSLTIAGFEGSLSIQDDEEKRYGIISGGEVSVVDEKAIKRIRNSEIIRQVALGQRPESDLSEVINSTIELENENAQNLTPTGDLKPINLGDTSTDQSTVEQEVLSAYKGDPAAQKAIAKEIKKLDKKFGNSTEALRSEFFSTVQQKDVYRTIGALMLLAQKDDLLNFISADQKLNKFLLAIWEKQYGLELVNDFKANPTDSKYVKLFLQYVLEQRLGLSENDAARVGLQIGNAFAAIGKKSYNKMAYFDVTTKQFNWFE